MESNAEGKLGIVERKDDEDSSKRRSIPAGNEPVNPSSAVRPDPAPTAVSLGEYDGGLGVGSLMFGAGGGSSNGSSSTSARDRGNYDPLALNGFRSSSSAGRAAPAGNVHAGPAPEVDDSYDSVGNYNSIASYDSVGNYNSIAGYAFIGNYNSIAGYASKGNYNSIGRSNNSASAPPIEAEPPETYDSVGNYNTLGAYDSVGAHDSAALGRYNTRKPLAADSVRSDSYSDATASIDVPGEYSSRRNMGAVEGAGEGGGGAARRAAGGKAESTLGFAITVGAHSSDSLNRLYQAAESAYKAGRMETALGALACALEAVGALPTDALDPDDDRCMILRRMAMVHVASGDHSAAEARLKECIVLGEGLWARRIPTHELPLALCQMGNLRKDQKQLAAASGYFEAAADRWRSYFGNKPDKRLLYAMNGQAQMQGRMGQLLAAEELAGKVVSMARRLQLPELAGYERNHGIVKKLLQRYGAVADFKAMGPPPARSARSRSTSSLPAPTRSTFAVIREDSTS
eukprot:jgi/Mesvir1/15920/Mv08244-RA.1